MTYRYGIDGERLEVDEEEGRLSVHPTTCERGWIEVDGVVATVMPCPVCRPELLERLRARKDP